MRPFLKNNAAASVRQIGGKRRNNNYTIISRFQYEFVDLLFKNQFHVFDHGYVNRLLSKEASFADNSVVCWWFVILLNQEYLDFYL